MEAEKKPPVVSDMGAWAMNVVSSVGIIMANKQLMSSSGYAFAFGTLPATRLLPPPLVSSSSVGRERIWSPDPPALGEFVDLKGVLIAFSLLSNARSHHADRVPLHGHGARRVDL